MLVWGYRMRNLLYTLLGLLHNWSSYLLLGMEHLIPEMLHLKVGMLHRELGTLVLELQTWNLHRCMAQTQGSNKLTGQQKAGPSVASGMCAQKNDLVFAIILHLF
jgi:hypothetical protein